MDKERILHENHFHNITIIVIVYIPVKRPNERKNKLKTQFSLESNRKIIHGITLVTFAFHVFVFTE